jgi:hypothetical protein
MLIPSISYPWPLPLAEKNATKVLENLFPLLFDFRA